MVDKPAGLKQEWLIICEVHLAKTNPGLAGVFPICSENTANPRQNNQWKLGVFPCKSRAFAL